LAGHQAWAVEWWAGAATAGKIIRVAAHEEPLHPASGASTLFRRLMGTTGDVGRWTVDG
jgi:hypothetical protein